MAASWKNLFLISGLLQDAVLEHDAQSGDELFAGLTVNQSRAYIAIRKLLDKEEEDGISLKALSTALKVTPGAASEMVDVLVNKGIVTRTQNKSDRRAICINFPEEINRKHELAEQVIQQNFDRILNILSPEERTLFENLLEKISTKYNEKGLN